MSVGIFGLLAREIAGRQPAQACWCGIWTVDGPCLYHGTDLADRVARLLGDLSVTHDDDATIDDAGKWLAWIAICGMPGLFLLGDVTVSYRPTCEVTFTSAERAALIGDAIAGRWAW